MNSAIPYAYPPPRRSSLAFWVALILFFLLAGSLLMNLVLVAALSGSELANMSETRTVRESFVQGDAGSINKIAYIEVSGPIMSGSSASMFGPMMDVVETTIEALRAARDDNDVKAIVMEVDSPGGSITACDELTRAISDLRKKRKDIKIVAIFGDVAASGGYYISAGADRILARPTTITGSIGVIMTFFNIEGLFEKIGIHDVVLKSAEKKDIGSSSRPMSDEERALLQAIVDQMYQRFVDVVDEGRENLDREQVLALADGSIFTGQQAAENGLVDAVGFLDDAIEEAKKLAKISSARVIRYRRPPTLMDVMTGNVRSEPTPAGLLQRMEGALPPDCPRIYYLWQVR